MLALVIINNYLHDLATAFWFVGSYLYYRLIITALALDSGIILDKIILKLSRLNRISISLVLAFGFVRSLFFMELEWNPAVGKGLLHLVVLKHIILFLAVAFGFCYGRKASCLFLQRRGVL